jgi:hypothetical protein
MLSALDEVGLSAEGHLADGERARSEALQKDKAALERRFARWFPALEEHVVSLWPAETHPDHVALVSLVNLLSVVVEVMDLLGSRGLASHGRRHRPDGPSALGRRHLACPLQGAPAGIPGAAPTRRERHSGTLGPMSPRNRLQFAVTREDPNVELEVLARFPRSRLLLIASGGCTALTLRAVMPDAHITLVDANPEQLAHVDRKLAALRDLRGADRLRAFNVGAPSDPAGLSECGNFESLFRGLRGFVHDFVLPREAWLRFFGEGAFDVASCTRRSRAVLARGVPAVLLRRAAQHHVRARRHAARRAGQLPGLLPAS